MKRLFSAFIIIIMLIGMLPAGAFSASADTAPNVVEFSEISTYSSAYAMTISIFGRTTCPNTLSAIKKVIEAGLDRQENIRVLFIDYDNNDKKTIEAFASEYRGANITFCYDTNGAVNSAMFNYAYQAGFGNSIGLPLITFIKGDGTIFKITQGSIDADSLVYYANEKDPSDYLINIQPIGQNNYDYAFEVLERLNTLRESLNLNPLTMDAELLEAAMQRAAEVGLYFSHTRPDGSSCFTVFSRAKNPTGENIAMCQTSPAQVMNSWENSPGHYRNMVSTSAVSAGIGCFKASDGSLCWVQLFSSSTADPAQKSGTTNVSPTVLAQPRLLDLRLSMAKDPHALSKNTKTNILLTNCNKEFPYVDQVIALSAFNFSSSKSSVLSVSSSGTCTVMGKGTVAITAASKDLPDFKVTNTFVVGHTYSNTCDSSCNHCYATRSIKHTYSNACDKTCNVCKATRSIKHTYSNACDRSCNVCKATRSISHTYKRIVAKATLTKNGKISHKCSVCGYVASKKTTILRPSSFKLSTTAYTYTGATKKPNITIKDTAGKVLKKGTDYTASYSLRSSAVGTYKAKITFKGNYSGTKTLTYKVLPPKTTIAKLTAGKKQLSVAISKKTAQVQGYQVQYSTSKAFKNAKSKTTTATKLTLKGLAAKKTYYVRVRTYKTVDGKKYYSTWSTYKYKKTK